MKKLLMAAAFTVSALCMVVQTSAGQNARKQTQTTTSPISTQQFVNRAANSNMFEIQSSRLASEKSKSKEIQQFAQMLITDHQKAGDELKSLLRGQNNAQIKAPEKLDQEHARKLGQLKSAAGMDFDKSYMQMQVAGHRQAVDLFTAYSQNGDKAELKAWAGKTLPTLQHHLQEAEAIKLPQTTGGL